MWGYSCKAGPGAHDITIFACIYFLISRIKLKNHNNILLDLANRQSHCSTFPVLYIQNPLKKRIKNTYFHFCCFKYVPEIVILSLNFIDKILLLAIFFFELFQSIWSATMTVFWNKYWIFKTSFLFFQSRKHSQFIYFFE